MANGHSDEFRRDAVRIALTSGLTRRQVSTDLGVGLSTLNKWIKVFGKDAVVSGPDQDLARENERLRRENRQKPHQQKISDVTSSPYTHAAIFLGDCLIAEANFPHGVAKQHVEKAIKGGGCIAVLRSQQGFGGDRPCNLNAFVDSVIAEGRSYNLIGVVNFGKTTKQDGELDFIRRNYGKVTSSDEFAKQSFFCSAFIVACYSVVGVIGPSAQVAYVPNMFSPGSFHRDPTFG